MIHIMDLVLDGVAFPLKTEFRLFLNSVLPLDAQVLTMAWGAFAQLRRQLAPQSLLSQLPLTMVVNALLASHFYYYTWNCSFKSIWKLQLVQNAAA